MDDDSVLLLLADYKLDLTLPEDHRGSRKRFEELSIARWAVDELKIYILSHTDMEPIDACMRFIRQMSYYAGRYHSPKSRAMCNAAIETAEDIADIIMNSK